MNVQILTDYFMRYGSVFIFLIVLLEYMNMPGFPAGVIMPLAGLWAAKGRINFQQVMLLSLAAGMAGSWILYGAGRFGGERALDWIVKKNPKCRKVVEKYAGLLQRKGCFVVFTAKLLPMVRTIISIPAGALKMNFISYTWSSALGILLWNGVFIGIGYFLGDSVLTYIS